MHPALETVEAKSARLFELLLKIDGQMADVNDYGEATGLCNEHAALIQDAVGFLGSLVMRAHNLNLRLEKVPPPLPMVLHCPQCRFQHVDAPEPEKGWTNPPHKSHLCHNCGCVWRPADVPTNGVESIQTRGERDTWPV